MAYPELRDYPETPDLTGVKGNKNLLKRVSIYHAGYSSHELLLSLHASDDGGIHYTAAYYGCCILAGNVWHYDEGRTCDKFDEYPFLSTSRKADRKFRVKVPDDDILRGEKYFFHVPGYKMGLYPVVPDFEHWVFPDDREVEIPTPWCLLQPEESADLEDYPRRANTSCRITGTRIRPQALHLVPLDQARWYRKNEMVFDKHTNFRGYPMDSFVNTLYFRHDIHHLLDESILTLLPKPESKKRDTYSLVAHMLRRPSMSDKATWETLARFHNVKCLHVDWIPVQFLFAHFAWSIFNNLAYTFNKEAVNTRFRMRADLGWSKNGSDWVRKNGEDNIIPDEDITPATTGSKRKRCQVADDTDDDYADYDY